MDAEARLERALSAVVASLAVALSGFQLWQSVTGAVPATYLRPVHLTWILVLVFLRLPLAARGGGGRGNALARISDLVLALLAIAAGYRITTFDYDSIDPILHGLSPIDLFTGSVYLVLVLEATRRAVGGILTAVAGAFLLYGMYGNLLPEAVAHRGFGLERIVRFQVFTGDGLFGVPLGIAAGIVFVFILFGAFLEVTGAGKFFIDMAFAAAGKYRGGPAKATVLASAAMGSISGSAIANTVTTGALTIPMMKRLGYRSEQAAGIEAAASTGGQIMPPIMGAGAFIMAEFTNTPYRQIVLVSIVPALLYFLATLLYVHITACKEGLAGMSERPRIGSTLERGFHFLLPLVVLTLLLLLSYSPPLVGAMGCAAVVASSFVRAHTRVGPTTLGRALAAGALMALPVSTACAAAGLVVGVIGQSGIGLQFTELVISLAGGQLWLALALIAGAALILGMGLPVTAAYIVVSVMAAPALEALGVSLLAAHMIVFWLSQSSNVTPPIALAAFAGAGIAGAHPLRASVEAFKLAKGLFVVPLMMAYSDLLLLGSGGGWTSLLAVFYTVVLIAALAFAIEGFALAPTGSLERAGFALAGVLILHPGELTHLVGLAVFLLTAAVHLAAFRQRQQAAERIRTG